VKELTTDIVKFHDPNAKTEYLVRKINKMSDKAKLIKLADRYDNIRDLKTSPKKWADNFYKATKEISDKTKITTSMQKKMNDMLRQRLRDYKNNS
jgi:hypothetical protein